MLKRIFIISVFSLISQSIIAQETDCDYFGLQKPSTTPKDFNPQLLDLNGSFKYNVEIRNCEEIYFTTIDSRENIYVSKKTNNTWSAPKIASFSDPKYNDADPFLTEDGNRIYFISKRPTSTEDKRLDFNIWYADRENGEWVNPKPLPAPINSDDNEEYFFSISKKGNAFFASNRSGGVGSFDIYTTKVLEDNSFSEPKNVGMPLSSEKYEFDPYIAPDESFMLFSINEKGNSSLYCSFKNEDDEWTEPQNLGDKINLTNQDFAPSLSEDGKFIFYSNNGQLRWVSSEILNRFNKN